MNIIKQEIRPIGYCTLELSEAEIQSIVGCIEEIQMIKNIPLDKVFGLRGDIYFKLKELLKIK